MTRNLAESLGPGHRSPPLRGRALLDLLARQGVSAVERLAAAHEMVRLAKRDSESAAEAES
jgi:hypothetical protein